MLPAPTAPATPARWPWASKAVPPWSRRPSERMCERRVRGSEGARDCRSARDPEPCRGVVVVLGAAPELGEDPLCGFAAATGALCGAAGCAATVPWLAFSAAGAGAACADGDGSTVDSSAWTAGAASPSDAGCGARLDRAGVPSGDVPSGCPAAGISAACAAERPSGGAASSSVTRAVGASASVRAVVAFTSVREEGAADRAVSGAAACELTGSEDATAASLAAAGVPAGSARADASAAGRKSALAATHTATRALVDRHARLALTAFWPSSRTRVPRRMWERSGIPRPAPRSRRS